MRIEFTTRENGPARLVAEAEIIFDLDEPIAGLKLTGFSLWRGADGETYVTFPSRAFGAGTERRYFDFLRSTDGTADSIRQFKGWILEQYAKTTASAAA